MGRRSWATKEQAAFLSNFESGLEDAKKTRTLQVEYARISREFLKRWLVKPGAVDEGSSSEESGSDDDGSQAANEENPVNAEKKPLSPEQLLARAEARRKCVSHTSVASLGEYSDHDRQQIHNWFKNRRKSRKRGQPKALLDLTGKKTSRKPTPYQLHQAYSIKYHRPADSPLRKEVLDLWERREEPEVVDILSKFSNSDDPPASHHLTFHNAIMRWKCSLLTDEERKGLEDWILESVIEKKEENARPWKAEVGDDELAAENEYIQRHVVLPSLCLRHLRLIKHSGPLMHSPSQYIKPCDRSSGQLV